MCYRCFYQKSWKTVLNSVIGIVNGSKSKPNKLIKEDSFTKSLWKNG